jgi:hypothetical protein
LHPAGSRQSVEKIDTMTVQVELEHDVQTVFTALTDPKFLVNRNLALGELSAQRDGPPQTRIRRAFIRVLPGRLRHRFLGMAR